MCNVGNTVNDVRAPGAAVHPQPHQVFSYDEVAVRVAKVRSEFNDRGWRIHPTSAMGRLFSRMEKFAVDWKTKPKEEIDPTEVLHAGHAHRISSAIVRVIDDPRARSLLHQMHQKSFVLGDMQQSRGKDLFWELELYVRLLLQGTAARFEEPDIVADLRFGPYAIACKKLYSEKGLEKVLQTGANQIKRSGFKGIVALNIEDLIPLDSLRVLNTTTELLAAARACAAEFVERNFERMQKFVYQGKLDAILVALATSAPVRETTAGFITTHWATIWTLNEAPKEAHERLVHVRKSFESLLT